MVRWSEQSGRDPLLGRLPENGDTFRALRERTLKRDLFPRLGGGRALEDIVYQEAGKE